MEVALSSETVHIASEKTFPSRSHFCKRSGALGDQPGVAILGYMLLAQGERFGVVTEGELVFASPALIDLIGEAVKLALVGIKLLFADERIVLREY